MGIEREGWGEAGSGMGGESLLVRVGEKGV